MLNPLTDKPLRRSAAGQVKKLRTIRRNARKDARSGNPAKRFPAQHAMRRAAALIRGIYIREASR